jgi:HEAT repeat protein
MADSYIEEKAVEAMVAINAAIQKIRFYPPSSTLTGYSVNEAYQHIQDIFLHKNSFIITKSENNILICEDYLSEKEQNKIQVSSFLDLLFGFGFFSIAFKKGLEKEEFAIFLEILSEKPEQIKKEGGIHQVITQKKLPHISLDEPPLIAGSNLKHAPTAHLKTETAKAAARDWKPDKRLDRDVIPLLLYMLDSLLEEKDKSLVSQMLARSIINKDDDTIVKFLIQEREFELGKQLRHHILNASDNKKFEALLFKIRYMYDNTPQDSGQAIRKAYQNMINSDKGKPFKQKSQQERTLFKERLNCFLKGDKTLCNDKAFLDSLSETIEKLFAQKNIKAIELIMNKLGEMLLDEDRKIRDDISHILAQMGEKLIAERRIEILLRMSWKLMRWIQLETHLTPAYEKICSQLRIMIRFLIQNDRFSECHQMLKLFNILYSGKAKKEEAIRKLAGNILESLSTSDILDPIIKDFGTNESGNRKQAAEELVHLGAASANRLMMILRESENKSERSRILRVLSDMGYAVIIPLTEQLNKADLPWYYLRNLILLFGRVGSEDHVDIFSHFLTHEDVRVRRETLNSIWNIGGKKSETVLLNALSVVDDFFKINIISTLGAMKSKAAVPYLLTLLESMGSVQPQELRSELAKKICAALGNIGTYEATIVLTEIFEQKNKKLLLKKPYNEELKKFATEILAVKGGDQIIDRDKIFSNKNGMISSDIPMGTIQSVKT